jgi:hypothetical protein
VIGAEARRWILLRSVRAIRADDLAFTLGAAGLDASATDPRTVIVRLDRASIRATIVPNEHAQQPAAPLGEELPGGRIELAWPAAAADALAGALAIAASAIEQAYGPCAAFEPPPRESL